MPAASAFFRLAALSSKATTSAPPARSACALTRPEPPRPNTATFRPAKVAIGITTGLTIASRLLPAKPRRPPQNEHLPGRADNESRPYVVNHILISHRQERHEEPSLRISFASGLRRADRTNG